MGAETINNYKELDQMKKIIMFFLSIILIINLTACQNVKAPEAVSTQQNKSAIEVTDLKGSKVTLDKIPQRIVSLSPANTELLFALGVGDKVVGDTSFCDYPEQAKNIQKIGDFEGPNLELIQKVQPDVVLAGGYIQEELIKKLQELKIPVVSTEASDFNSIYDSIKLIGQVTGTEANADKIIAEMKSSVDQIKNKTKDMPKKKVFYVVWTDPITTAGSGTFINDVINIAGGVNMAEKVTGWAKYSAETLTSDNPDILVSSHYATNEGIQKEFYSNAPVFKNLDCVKKGNVYVVSDDNIMIRPTPRIIQGIEELVKVFSETK